MSQGDFLSKVAKQLLEISRELHAHWENDCMIPDEINDCGKQLFEIAEEFLGPQSPPYEPEQIDFKDLPEPWTRQVKS